MRQPTPRVDGSRQKAYFTFCIKPTSKASQKSPASRQSHLKCWRTKLCKQSLPELPKGLTKNGGIRKLIHYCWSSYREVRSIPLFEEEIGELIATRAVVSAHLKSG